MNALAFCLQLAGARARLAGKLDDELGTFHGLGFDDFVLLHELAAAEHGRLPAAALARALGLLRSALVRRLPPLEKTGLIEREAGQVVLRPAGLRLLRQANESAEAVCHDALRDTAPDDLRRTAAALRALGTSPALAT